MATEFNTQVGNGEYRLQFETDNKAHYLIMQSAARRCIDHAHMTNADRIRSMSDEELATFMNCNGCPPKNEGCNDGQKCSLCWLEWLQQPAEVADNETVEERKDGDGNG